MLLSGGIDSATCIPLVKMEGYEVRAMTVRFYGMAEGEMKAAIAIGREGRVKEHRFFALPGLREIGDMRDDKSFGGLPRTYIPMKNAIYYSLAASFAEEVGASCIAGGHNADDQRLFRDTGDVFFRDLQRALRNGSGTRKAGKLVLLRPLRKRSKAEVVSLAAKLGVPLRLTWSCHGEGTRHCGGCEGCAARRKAFAQAGITDPLGI